MSAATSSPAAGPLVKSTQLAGQEELASRKGTWRYEAGSNSTTTEAAADGELTAGPARADDRLTRRGQGYEAEDEDHEGSGDDKKHGGQQEICGPDRERRPTSLFVVLRLHAHVSPTPPTTSPPRPVVALRVSHAAWGLCNRNVGMVERFLAGEWPFAYFQ